MVIHIADSGDLPELKRHDHWITARELERKIFREEVYVLREGDAFIGWMRYGLFWDNTPFLHMLHILEGYQKKGYGTAAMEVWEKAMKKLGYGLVMTSTAVNETAQHFYQKLGYSAVGSFSLEDQPLELLFAKTL